MMSDALKKQSRVLFSIGAGVLLAGCAATKPAPVVHRTSPNKPAVASAPAQPGGQAGNGAASQAPATAPVDEGPQVSPIYQGSVHQQGGNTSPDDPNLKVGPQGVKRAYGAPKPGAVASAQPVTQPSQPRPADTANAGSAAAGARAKAAKAPAVPSSTRTYEGIVFSWPVLGKVLQPFDGDSHKGLLLAGTLGEPVLAAADGKVIFSGVGPRGYGNLLIIKHSDTVLSVYAHARTLLVKQDAKIKRGQQVAELGSTGTNRPALYFEVRRASKPVDPIGVLPKR
ncbi:MAG: peptidoglycan DD-metalloendopeptidase family protein [Lautropia sp.]|nr:peptidoglycan DD-metalloendopeptidase family protein [Lautropia sp.]